MVIPVWRAKIDGTDPIPILTLYATTNHTTGATYLPMRRTTVYGGPAATNYGETLWRLFCDRFHRPNLIYQMAIISPGGALGLPTPERTHKGRTISGLNLLGAELEISIALDRTLYLPQKMQLLPLLQWRDETAFHGHGTTYLASFVALGRPTLDVALGADSISTRNPAGQTIPAISPITYTFKFDECEMHDMGANPVKLFQQYSIIGSGQAEREDVFAQLLNNIIITFHIPDAGSPLPVLPNGPADGTFTPPATQPPDNVITPGTGGIWYIGAVELRVDPDLNPNAVELIL